MRFLAALALLATPETAVAQTTSEAPSVVKTFDEICLAGGLDPAARPAALAAAGWSKDASVTVDVPQLGISRAIERNYDFSKPERSEQWSGLVDGKPAIAVLAGFPAKRRYPNICAILINGVSNAMPYANDVKVSFKRFGIGGKSVDLVHYFEFAGKVGNDKHPVRGEIFSRSLAGRDPKSMHIYVAY